MWYIGQKVVCIETDSLGWLIVGKVYTITWISNRGGLRLKEQKHHPSFEAFASYRFRPLLTDSIEFAEETLERIKTNIEIEIEEPILN